MADLIHVAALSGESKHRRRSGRAESKRVARRRSRTEAGRSLICRFHPREMGGGRRKRGTHATWPRPTTMSSGMPSLQKPWRAATFVGSRLGIRLWWTRQLNVCRHRLRGEGAAAWSARISVRFGVGLKAPAAPRLCSTKSKAATSTS